MEIGASGKLRLLAAVATGLLIALLTQGAEPKAAGYCAATLTSDGFGANSRLVLFPSDGKELSIPLPLPLGYFVYGPSGQTLYARASKRLDSKSVSATGSGDDASSDRVTVRVGGESTTIASLPGLFKIELKSVRAEPLPGLHSFRTIERFVVSRRENIILFEGTRNDPEGRTCGIYELTLPGGNIRRVLQSSDCRAGSPWRIFDLSPDATEALISADRHLAVLDVAQGKVTPIGGTVWRGVYSPDGKWIAALESIPGTISKVILIDPKDFSRRRGSGISNEAGVVWSPDSRFLLYSVYRPACPSRAPLALETLDIETGKRLILKSSICTSGSGIGWISCTIGQR